MVFDRPENGWDHRVSRRTVLKAAPVGLAAVWGLPGIGRPLNAEARTRQSSSPAGSQASFTRELAAFVSSTPGESIPDEYREYAKIIFLDTIGVALAASLAPLVTKLIAFADLMGGNAQSRLLVANESRRSATHAALISGAAAHAFDFDDSSSRFWGHASASLVPSLMAIADMEGSSGLDVLNAYLIGLEAGFVVADSVGEAMYAGGFHNTSSLGVSASGAACARL